MADNRQAELFPEIPVPAGTLFASVLPFDGGGNAYTYRVPEAMAVSLSAGMLVRVPLGRRKVLGIVWDFPAACEEAIAARAKAILEFLYPFPVLAADEIDLCRWLSAYYACSLNSVINTVIPLVVREGVRPLLEHRLSLVAPFETEVFEKLSRRAKKQAELYRRLAQSPEAVLRNTLPYSAVVVNALVKSGLVRQETAPVSRVAYADSLAGTRERGKAAFDLNEEQRSALAAIATSLDERVYRTHLLFGVTGSGKTEVYIEAIRKVLAEGGSAIFLVPEVALTPQTVERLRSRLDDCGTQTVVWHSHLSSGERFDAWMDMARGNARVLVGARSAIFAPMKNLRLIIVDEEHEPSFKQGETPFYHGRDLAVYRASKCGAVCVLGSATPSIESFSNALNGKYVLNRIANRVDAHPLPQVSIVDMRREILNMRGQTTFSRTMLKAIRERLDGHEQCILFLNRRGYSRALICPDCGYVATCPHCSAPLTFHRHDRTLRCHLCGYIQAAISQCPQCKSESIKKRGYGTQRAEEILRDAFPQARIRRLDGDTMSKKNEFREILAQFRNGDIDILLGTQMIAKGLDFPRVTLAGIIDADLSLHIPDFRAAERTFQLLVQVSGRAGRGDLDGEVIVQTFTPFAAPIQYAKEGDYEGFVEEELQKRREFNYPPSSHLIRHLFRSEDEALLERTVEAWKDFVDKNAPGLCAFKGPCPCTIEKLQDFYRWHLFYVCDRVTPVVATVSELRSRFPWPKGVIEIIDVDAVESM
ncbi:MAG: primosomal protein N' [Opitutales bacterium]|nr:primosomal protein N' [Opitutales bacterium]